MKMDSDSLIIIFLGSIGAFFMLRKLFIQIIGDFLLVERHRTEVGWVEHPPALPGWPIVGNYPLFTSKNFHYEVMQHGQVFRGIFSVKLMNEISIFVTSYKLISEALIQQGMKFAGRPPEMSAFGIAKLGQCGITAAGIDKSSRKVRSFSLACFRNLGVSSLQMQDTVLTEVNFLLKELRRKEVGFTDILIPNIREILTNTAGNIIAKILFSKRYEYDDADLQFFCRQVPEMVTTLAGIQTQEKLMPWKRVTEYRAKRRCAGVLEKARRYLDGMIKEHKDTRIKGQIRDFIDAWLEHADLAKEKQEQFDRHSLPGVLFDVFLGGFGEIATTVEWIICMLLHHPEIQTKVHKELMTNTSGPAIQLQDRENLPYTEAVMLETLRMFPVAPFGVPHLTMEDSVIGGYNIQKGTRVNFHILSVHYDAELWENPKTFNPDRFLDGNGRLLIPQHFIPFSIGRRSCLGEMLALKEIFLIYANFVKVFDVKNPLDQPLPSWELQPGFILHPKKFNLILHERV